MRFAAIILYTVGFSFTLTACLQPPLRPQFGRLRTDNVVPETDPSTDPDNPVTTNPKNGDNTVDIALTRDTLSKIMEAPGGTQDNACLNKPTTSKNQLRLLTSDEYVNTVQDVLQITTDYRASLPTETTVFGFRNNADVSQVSDAHAAAYLDVALSVADEAKAKLQNLVQCSETDGVTCGQKVINMLAPQLWRRPLEAAEKSSLLNMYKVGLASSPTEGMTILITDILMSPNFLYRSEIGKSGALTAYELASAVSYFFWGSAPDASLQAAAANGSILTDAGLVAQVQRYFSSPRSKYTSTEFANVWLESRSVLGASKDATLFPLFTQPVKNAMAAEAVDTFEFMIKQPTTTFENLFTFDSSLGDANLAQYYRGALSQDTGVAKIKYAANPRKGVLSFGAVLSHLATPTETHPIKRGDYVLKNMFCHIPEPTPSGLVVTVPPANAAQTTRERFAAHTADPKCAGCHIAIDGIGFGMEDFDGAGVFRDMDHGKKVDTTGEVVGIDSATTKFSGVGELSAYIASSSQAKRCFVVEWYRLAHGYTERPADICAIRDIANKFEKGNMTLSRLIIQIITHPSYAKKEQ